MNTCPLCKKSVKHLEYVEEVDIEEVFRIGQISELPEYSERLVRTISRNYRCPECRKTLFKEEKEAEKFLKGDKITNVLKIVENYKEGRIKEEEFEELIRKTLKL